MRHRRTVSALGVAALLALASVPAAAAAVAHDPGGMEPPSSSTTSTTGSTTSTTGDPTTSTTAEPTTSTTEPPTSTTVAPGGTVDVQILALNDFHGNLEPGTLAIDPATGSSSSAGKVPAGGAAYLASKVAALEADQPNSLVVSAGDLVGASPLLSALFHDEPTVEAMNLIGLDLNAVGNHEFDEGGAELRRLQDGGCHPTDGCLDGDEFAGADFGFLAANVIDTATGEPFFAPYAIEDLGGARIAFIGMTLEGTPTIVSPSGVAGLEFQDEADTVNALLPELKDEEDVDGVVVLLHEGGSQTGTGPKGINDCTNLQGPIVDIVGRFDPGVDLVISGHTHQAYDCVVDGTVVTSASSFGRVLTDIDLTVDTDAGAITAIATENLVVTRDLAPNGAVEQLIARYQAIAEPLASRVIGSSTGEITRTATAAGESPLGDVIADAQLAATAAPDTGAAVIAFMNPGGIRADLNAGETAPGDVTYGEAFTVQPFGNNLVTLTYTGAQIDAVLEQQFCNVGPDDTVANARILQVSTGFAYSWDAAAPCGQKVDPATTTLAGVPLGPAATYRVTVNSFLADGGDGFKVLPQGEDRLGGGVDTDAFEAYFEANSPVAPGPADRITTTGTPAVSAPPTTAPPTTTVTTAAAA